MGITSITATRGRAFAALNRITILARRAGDAGDPRTPDQHDDTEPPLDARADRPARCHPTPTGPTPTTTSF
jgi:hypothetical protein